MMDPFKYQLSWQLIEWLAVIKYEHLHSKQAENCLVLSPPCKKGFNVSLQGITKSQIKWIEVLCRGRIISLFFCMEIKINGS